MEQILSGCSKPSADRGYCWRHDQILKAIAQNHQRKTRDEWAHLLFRAHQLCQSWGTNNTTPAVRKFLGILALAKDWKMSLDLGTQLKFPSTLRPAPYIRMLFYGQIPPSMPSLVELLALWEEAHEKKNLLYMQMLLFSVWIL